MDKTKVYRLTQLKLDSSGEGTFEAVFATLDAVDSDGDSYDPGSIGTQEVVISQWNHGSWGGGAGALPIGIGKVFERGNEAIITGEFDLSDEDAVKHYNKLKYLFSKGRNVEWSFALPESDWRVEEQDGERVRIFTRIKIPEVSPVLLGAGINTRLLEVKSGSEMKSAIPSHETETTEVAWDAGRARRNTRSGESYAYYRRIFAWAPEGEDREDKSKYKFPHHQVSSGGEPGAANMRACSATIAVLNGGRGGADIPAGDRRGVYNHVAKHMRDGEREVPELRSLDSPRKRISSKRFVDQIGEAVETAEAVARRAAKIRALRDAEGGEISKRSQRQLKILREAMTEVVTEIDAVLAEPEDFDSQASAIAAQFEEAR